MNEAQPTGQQNPGSLQGRRKEQHDSLLVPALLCFAGAFVTAGITVVGVALVAYATAALKSANKFPLAVVMTLIGAGASFSLGTVSGATALIVSIAALLISYVAAGKYGQVRLFLSVILVAIGLLGIDVIDAYLAGTTIQGRIAAMTSTVLQQVTAAGSVPAESVNVLKDALTTVVQLWPSFYVFEAIIYVAVAVILARITYRHLIADYAGPHFSEFDLSVQFVWPLIVGLLCLAASYLDFQYAAIAKVVAYNFIACSAFIYAVQGFALIDYLMRRRNVHWALQILIYLFALQLELMFLIPSFMGLIDMWANIRKLPRKGSRTPTEAKADKPADGDQHR